MVAGQRGSGPRTHTQQLAGQALATRWHRALCTVHCALCTVHCARQPAPAPLSAAQLAHCGYCAAPMYVT